MVGDTDGSSAMIGQDTPCKVVGLPNVLQRVSRRGVAAVPAGTRLFYLWHEPTGLYYEECYVSEAYAIKLASRLLGPRSMSDVAQCWRSEPKHCHHSWKTED